MGKKPLSPSKIEALKAKRKEQKQHRKANKKEFQAKRQAVRQHLESLREDQKEEEVEEGKNSIQTEDMLESSQNQMTGKDFDYLKGVFEKHKEKAKRYYEVFENQKTAQEQKDGQGGEENSKPAEEPKLSITQQKKQRWIRVAQLKARVRRPDLVEAWDITAPDPIFLCEMKTLKNTVGVPRHWNQKSKFLQTKRGILKAMFKLPEFIEATGISKLRDPFNERDGSKMVREKLRERMNPKLGKIDIQYSVLHDAFFKYQTKSDLTIFGDIYYEGKEDESKAKQYKPGVVSQSLRMALGISDYQAPPWIINMQRYGAPPSYPTLRILGSQLPFSQVASYSIINKAGLEEVARKLGQPGLYATFRTMYQEEEEEFVDKGYWGQINNLDEINDELPEEQWEQEQDDEQF